MTRNTLWIAGLVVCSLGLSLPAGAQPQPDGPYLAVPAPPLPPGSAGDCVEVTCTSCAGPCPPSARPAPPRLALPSVAMSWQDQLKLDPAYRSARRRRTAGILVAAIGGAVGFGLGAVGMMAWEEDGHTDDDGKALAIGGFITAGLSVAIGIPLAISGQRELSRIRARYQAAPAVSFGPTRGGAAVQLAWQF